MFHGLISREFQGSTCTFSEAILRHCGFRTGLFTSPHLIDVRERYRINGSVCVDDFLFKNGNFHVNWQNKLHVSNALVLTTMHSFIIFIFILFLCCHHHTFNLQATSAWFPSAYLIKVINVTVHVLSYRVVSTEGSAKSSNGFCNLVFP